MSIKYEFMRQIHKNNADKTWHLYCYHHPVNTATPTHGANRLSPSISSNTQIHRWLETENIYIKHTLGDY